MANPCTMGTGTDNNDEGNTIMHKNIYLEKSLVGSQVHRLYTHNRPFCYPSAARRSKVLKDSLDTPRYARLLKPCTNQPNHQFPSCLRCRMGIGVVRK